MSFVVTPNKKHMLRAIELSRYAALEAKCGGVFGAVIVSPDGEIIAEGYNQVLRTFDPTCHAEIDAIRKASAKLKTPHLEGCVLYTSAECCPMCLSAAYWAHIKHIFYASSMQDAAKYGQFQDVDFLAEIKKNPEHREIKSTSICSAEAIEVWKEYAKLADKKHY